MEETFKDIEGFEGLYQISNFGRVKSSPRNGTTNNPLILSLHENGRGYLRVNLWRDKKYITRRISRLVALAFIPNPKNLKEINHKDGNKLNNHVDNLEWCTRSENLKHAYKLGLRTPIHASI